MGTGQKAYFIKAEEEQPGPLYRVINYYIFWTIKFSGEQAACMLELR
jgi:hypothetical protein